VVHSTALNSSDNLPSYPPDNHHSSEDVYRRGGGLSIQYLIVGLVSLAIKLETAQSTVAKFCMQITVVPG